MERIEELYRTFQHICPLDISIDPDDHLVALEQISRSPLAELKSYESKELYRVVQRIQISDIATLPRDQQHIILERIEQLEDDLRLINKRRIIQYEPH